LSSAMLPRKGSQWKLIKRDFVRNRVLYLMVLPVLAFYIIFSYVPMFGVIIAFKDYSPAKGILGSPFTDMYGLRHFADFMTSPFFGRLIRNTVLISLYSLVFAFPAPILFALLLNELQNKMFKRITQTISYFPHFVSLVVVCGMLTDFSLSDGLFNQVRAVFGLEAKSLLQETAYFRTIYVSSGVWKEVGWGSIIYLAAIAGIDSQLYEAAALDGAGRLRSTVHITLPSIKPTIVILFIMQVGNMLSVGSEKIILLQNPATLEVADVISSYVYRRGLLEFSWSFSSAVGLFNSIINFALVFMANGISRKLTESSLF
jgi:putative aldouronate transport system permease protein